MRRSRLTVAAAMALAGGVIAGAAACGSNGPDQHDVDACHGLKQTISQLPNGTVGNAGTQDEAALMGWQAIAHDSQLRSDVQNLEQAVMFANPGAGAYSQAGYDSEDSAVKAIGSICAGDGVNGIADGW